MLPRLRPHATALVGQIQRSLEAEAGGESLSLPAPRRKQNKAFRAGPFPGRAVAEADPARLQGQSRGGGITLLKTPRDGLSATGRPEQGTQHSHSVPRRGAV